jgi:peptidoglycan/LPS O-acetylase OafA/YrhL
MSTTKTKPSEDLLELRRETAHDAAAGPTSKGHKHIPSLDGIRGAAVLMVFLVHYGGGAKSANPLLHFVGVATEAGWCGVTLFFILSGFLISGIIWDSREREHWLRRFYFRRTLRIFPIYYASLLLIFLTALYFRTASSSPSRIWMYALYLQNVPLPLHSASLGSPLKVDHLWSLAVEEQFYLMWPFLLGRIRKLDHARMLCIAVFVLSAAFRVIAWYLIPATDPSGASLHRIFHGAYGFTLCRAGELAAGAYLAMCYRDPAIWKRIKAIAPYALLVGACGFILSGLYAHTFTDECAAGFMVGLPMMTILLAAVLVLALGDGVVNRLARLRWLRWLGGISYGFYIFHVLFTSAFEWIATKLTHQTTGNLFLGTTFVVALTLSTLLAWLSFRFFESHFLRLKNTYGARSERVATGN